MNKRVNELFIAADSIKEWFVVNWPAIEAAFQHPDIQKIVREVGTTIVDPSDRLAKLDRALVPFRGSFVEVIGQEKRKDKFREVAEMSFLAGRAFMLLLDASTQDVIPSAVVKELESLAIKIQELGGKEAPWLFEGDNNGNDNTLDSKG